MKFKYAQVVALTVALMARDPLFAFGDQLTCPLKCSLRPQNSVNADLCLMSDLENEKTIESVAEEKTEAAESKINAQSRTENTEGSKNSSPDKHNDVGVVSETSAAPAQEKSNGSESDIKKPESGASAQIGNSKDAEDEDVPETAKVINRHKNEVVFSQTYPKNYPFPLVAIRFPVDYENLFSINVQSLKAFKKSKPVVAENLVNEQVVKSAYFAAEFYHYLKPRLPEHSIVLIPTKLQFGKDGKVVAQPMFKSLPAMVCIDFFADVNRKRVENSTNLDSEDTFGNRLKTVLSIRGIEQGKLQLIAGSAVIDPSSHTCGETVESFYNNTCTGLKLKNVANVEGRPVHSKGTYEKEAFCELEKTFKCRNKAIALQAQTPAGGVTPAAAGAWGQYSDFVIEKLNTQNFDADKPVLMTEYLKDLTPDFCERHSKASNDNEVVHKRKDAYLTHYIARERDHVFAPQSQKLGDELWKGAFGDAMRTQIKAEGDYAKKVEASKRRQGIATALSLASAAGAVATAVSAPQTGLAPLLVSVSIAGGAIVKTESSLQKQLRECFSTLDMNLNQNEISFLLKLDGDVVEVSGKNIDELRTRMQQGYDKRFNIVQSGLL